MSKQCPINHQRCHDPLCDNEICLLECYPRADRKDVTIGHLAAALDRLTKGREHPKPARYLAMQLTSGTLINSVSFQTKNKQQMADVSFKAAGGATFTWVALDANGNVTTNGIDLTKPITALSNHPEFFTATMVVDTTGALTIPLQTKLAGVADGDGTITYAATSIDGTALTLVHNVSVADIAPPVAAASITGTYVTF